MATTTHGYHIVGSDNAEDDPYRSVAKCGGPAVCNICNKESSLYQAANGLAIDTIRDIRDSFVETPEGETLFVPDDRTPDQVATDIQAAQVKDSDDGDNFGFPIPANDINVEDGIQSDILKQAKADMAAAEARIAEQQAEQDLMELDFEHQLTSLINRHSAENESGTPDYILAEYLLRCLVTFNETVKARAIWRGEDVRLHGDITVKP